MAKTRSWEVSDAFWERVGPFIPVLPKRNAKKEYKRKAGGGRKPMDTRKVFEGIVYVLRTGCQWKALPKERFGSASSIHSYFLQWLRDGSFFSYGVPVWQNTMNWRVLPGSGKVLMEHW